ncbi:hypothetical protein T06_11047 [Trichinella sp. T6]|nr:hypothetical protein T06_11047 [Trichinella sp. T6]
MEFCIRLFGNHCECRKIKKELQILKKRLSLILLNRSKSIDHEICNFRETPWNPKIDFMGINRSEAVRIQKSEATPFKSLSWSLQLVPFNQPLTGLNSRRERHSPKYNVLHLCVIHQAMFRANMKIALNVPYRFSKDRDVSPVFSLKATCNSDPEIGTIMFAGFSININETLEMDFVGFNRSEKIKGVQQTYPGDSQLSIFRDIQDSKSIAEEILKFSDEIFLSKNKKFIDMSRLKTISGVQQAYPRRCRFRISRDISRNVVQLSYVLRWQRQL